MSRPRKPINHGTRAGAAQHRRRGEKPCADCHHGELAADAARRAANKPAGSTTATLEGPRKTVVPLGRWTDRAACRGEDPELFFSPDGEQRAEREIREEKAKRICMGCPVRTDCLDEALVRDRYGVFGGLSEDERQAERRRRSRKKARRADRPDLLDLLAALVAERDPVVPEAPTTEELLGRLVALVGEACGVPAQREAS